ncbi:tyrosine-protein phosphatase [Acididesulfobacillus acetoxydans]|nr:CpsB/CapC family capsule biosynthesis tyrosine phosphatase [Acididesulfobacillus acetoxydans]
MIDFHCHLLPGLDDGAESLEEGLGIARQLREAGFTTVVATPHVMEGRVMLTPGEIEERVGDLNQALRHEGIDLNVLPGAENHIFPAMAGYLQEGSLLSVGGKGKHLLLELPAWEIPPYTEQVFFELKVAGVTPVLAHPERYPALGEAPGRLRQWLKLGVLLQIDLRSLSGHYGRQAKDWAKELAGSGLVHLLGSDAHSPSQRQHPYRDELDKLQSLVGEARFQAVTKDYPRRILLGQDLPSLTEDILRGDSSENRRKSWFRWFGKNAR